MTGGCGPPPGTPGGSLSGARLWCAACQPTRGSAPAPRAALAPPSPPPACWWPSSRSPDAAPVRPRANPAGTSTVTSLDAVTVAGAPGAKPKVTFVHPFSVTETDRRVLVLGKGPAVAKGQRVSIDYVGINGTDGKEFDTSYGRKPASFMVDASQVIKGFADGLIGVKVGLPGAARRPAEGRLRHPGRARSGDRTHRHPDLRDRRPVGQQGADQGGGRQGRPQARAADGPGWTRRASRRSPCRGRRPRARWWSSP